MMLSCVNACPASASCSGRGVPSRRAAAPPPLALNQQPLSHKRAGLYNRVAAKSHHGRLELELAGADVQAVAAAAAAAQAPADSSCVQYDCLGLAQAMVDISSAVDESLLAQLGVEKGSRRLIGIEERAAVLGQLEGADSVISAGGSLSNTLLALARLGDASALVQGEAPLRVGMMGLVGSDPLGAFYTAQMQQAGVHVASAPLAGANTGTVLVLTSPDAQRTMLSYLGTEAAEVAVDAAMAAAIARSRLLVVEGYLFELPNAQRTITKAIAAAQRHGCVVAMTAGDAGVVERHHAEMWAAIDQGVDLLFTNASEAAALLRYEPKDSPQLCVASGIQQATATAAAGHCATGEQLALRLGPHCSLVVVTDGDKGSYLTALGQLHCVPPVWLETAPVDTCGAGDAYAAGLLYGYLRHFDLVSMGRTAARAASAVIAKHGAQLSAESALAVAEGLASVASRSASPGAPASPSNASLAPSTPRVA